MGNAVVPARSQAGQAITISHVRINSTSFVFVLSERPEVYAVKNLGVRRNYDAKARGGLLTTRNFSVPRRDGDQFGVDSPQRSLSPLTVR